MKKLTVLVGNGLSIACNPDFRVEKLTEAVIDEMRNNDLLLGSVYVPMLRIAQKHEHLRHDVDFEDLLGPHYLHYMDLRRAMEIVETYAPSDSSARSALETATEAAWGISRTGLKAVLAVLFRTAQSPNSDISPARDFIELLHDHFPEGLVSYFTLNFDNLLHRAVRAIFRDFSTVQDLAEGWSGKKLLVQGRWPVTGNRLRSQYRVRNSNIRAEILHLHGSLQFWREGISGDVFKLSDEAIRSADLLKSLGGVKPKMLRPVVLVGTSELKAHFLAQAPYAQAFERMRESLAESTHLVIAGTSMRDEHIREEVLSAMTARDMNVMVVDKCETPPEWLAEINNLATGSSRRGSVFLHLNGLETLGRSKEWVEFAKSSTGSDA
jgi:NAD-dependent SIR2 family protein deacetylase